MRYDRKTTQTVKDVIGNLSEEFMNDPVLRDSSIAVYGTSHKLFSEGAKLPSSRSYDVDLLIVLPSRNQTCLSHSKRILSRIADRSSKKDLEVTVSCRQGTVKLDPSPERRRLLLHALLHDERTLTKNPVYFQSRITHNHAHILGTLPPSFYVERFGFTDIIPELERRITMLDSSRNWFYEFDEEGNLERHETELVDDKEILEAIGPYVVHGALNVCAILHPYMINEYPDNNLKSLAEFRRNFPGLSHSGTPLEIREALAKIRDGKTANVTGCKRIMEEYFIELRRMVKELVGDKSQLN